MTLPLVEQFQYGLDAPICLTWELTYACNLSCVHCLSSSGRRDPRELSTAECRAVIDELERMQVFYVNIGGGEPTVRPDFWELVDYATAHHVGVKFSTNGIKITPEVARRLAGSDYVDVQISLDGATAEVNDAVRGPGSYATALAAMGHLADAGFAGFKISVVVTRQNAGQLDDFKAIADRFGAQLRLTRLRPSGRGADVWDELHPTAGQQRELYDWLVARGEQVLTGDSFFHLAAYGDALPGLNLCGAGRVVCLIDPVGDVYACPFAIHDSFLAGNVRARGGFTAVWRESELFADLRRPQTGGACQSCSAYDSCRGGCMAAKFFTGLPLDGPDPECVKGHGERALAAVVGATAPRPSGDHSHRSRAVPVTIGARPPGGTGPLGGRPPDRACDESPLAGFSPDIVRAGRAEMADRGDAVSLLDPVRLAGRTAPSRVVFGPHETNLGDGRALSARHVAYYGRRAAGGAGVIITEVASVLDGDWPYERAPLAAACRDGWRQIAAACQPAGTVLLAGLGHAGLQGSSAYSQRELWGPSGFTDPVSRETPMVMGQAEIDAVIDGFAAAAALAAAAGADGVEIDAGPGALLRQFHSGLTNQRTDAYGADRLALTRAVLAAVRGAIGAQRVLALRLCCDELAPWAGVTPQFAAGQAAALAPQLDLLTVVRGGPYAGSAGLADAHTPPQFNQDLAAAIRAATGGAVPVVLQGSVVDPGAASAALAAGAADLVEMTRAQIADGELVAKLRAGQPERIRPCLLCNQKCRVKDPRNPVVTCVGDPRSGYESVDPAEPPDTQPQPPDAQPHGAGRRQRAAGLARRAGRRRRPGRPGGSAGRGGRLADPVRLAERGARLGGALRAAAVGTSRQRMARLADWLEAECRRLGVTLETGTAITAADLDAARASGTEVILATGSRSVPRRDAGPAVDALAALSDPDLPPGPAVVDDPVGGPVGVAVAEWLAAAGRPVAIVSPDPVIGTQLSLSGDLADANVRLQRAGAFRREPRSRLRAAGGGTALLEDVWTSEQRRVDCAVLVDCGHRLPEEELYQLRPGTARAGDCVAPRSVHEAVLEGRRAAQGLRAGRELAALGAVT